MNDPDDVNISENESDFEYINKESESGIENESEESNKSVELQDLVADVMKIEDEINAEASNIVEISSHFISDQPLYLQPIPVEEVLDVRVDLMDEASSPIEELLTFDDGQKLEKEIEISAFCLEQIMPKTQSEVELEESDESDSENDLLSEENSFHLLENKFPRKKVLSGESTDSELDPFTQENKYKFTLMPKKTDNSITTDDCTAESEFILETENSGSLFLTESECILSDNELTSKPIKSDVHEEENPREIETDEVFSSAENVVSAILEDVLGQFDNIMNEAMDDIDNDNDDEDT